LFLNGLAPSLAVHNSIQALFEPGIEPNVPTQAVMIVDCGYSFTHVVPYYNGKPVNKAVKRIDVAGKALTNHLKEMVSFR
jgi:actin-related protein 6